VRKKHKILNLQTLGKSFGDSNRLNLQYIGHPEWYSETSKEYITEIIMDVLKNNESLKQERIEKIIFVVKERLKIFDNLIKQKKCKK